MCHTLFLYILFRSFTHRCAPSVHFLSFAVEVLPSPHQIHNSCICQNFPSEEAGEITFRACNSFRARLMLIYRCHIDICPVYMLRSYIFSFLFLVKFLITKKRIPPFFPGDTLFGYVVQIIFLPVIL